MSGRTSGLSGTTRAAFQRRWVTLAAAVAVGLAVLLVVLLTGGQGGTRNLGEQTGTASAASSSSTSGSSASSALASSSTGPTLTASNVANCLSDSFGEPVQPQFLTPSKGSLGLATASIDVQGNGTFATLYVFKNPIEAAEQLQAAKRADSAYSKSSQPNGGNVIYVPDDLSQDEAGQMMSCLH